MKEIMKIILIQSIFILITWVCLIHHTTLLIHIGNMFYYISSFCRQSKRWFVYRKRWIILCNVVVRHNCCTYATKHTFFAVNVSNSYFGIYARNQKKVLHKISQNTFSYRTPPVAACITIISSLNKLSQICCLKNNKKFAWKYTRLNLLGRNDR